MDADALRRAKEEYDRHGFCVVRGFLAGAALQEAQWHAKHYLSAIAPGKPDAEVAYLDRERPETVVAVFKMNETEYWRALPWSPDWLSLASACAGTAAVHPKGYDVDPETGQRFAGGLQLLNKGPAGASVPTPPHQENWYFNIANGESPTFWVALEAVDEANGTLRYLPGSHRQPLRQHSLSDLVGFSQTAEWTDADTAAEVALTLAPGDCVVHHVGVLHRADANCAPDRSRLAIGCVYQADSCTLDPIGYQRHLADLKQHNPPAWARAVADWEDAPEALRAEALEVSSRL